MCIRASLIGLAMALLTAGDSARAESPAAHFARTMAEWQAIAGDNENGTVVLHYAHGVVLGPFAGIEGTAYPVPCGSPDIALAPASVPGFYAQKGALLSAHLQPRLGGSGCELLIDKSRVFMRPIDETLE